jgi:hypothetical protein
MSDSFLAQKLVRFVDPTHEEMVYKRPFVYYVNGQAWSVAVSGPWLFAVRGTSSHEHKVESEMTKNVLTAMPSFAIEVSTSQLKEWVGKPPDVWAFPIEDRPEGAILNMVFDFRRLACLLDGIPFPKLVLWDFTSVVGMTSVVLDVKGKWRAVLAAIEGKPDEDHPVLDFAVPFTK